MKAQMNHTISKLLMVAALGVGSTSAIAAQTIPFPGNHLWPVDGHDEARSGFTPGVGPEDPSLLPPWPFEADGELLAAPVIDRHGFAYVGSMLGTFYALRRSAVSSAGLELWRFDAGGPIVAAAALATDPEGQTLVYLATESGDVYSLRGRDGSVRWHQNLGSPVRSSLVLTETSLEVWLYVQGEDAVYAIQDSLTTNAVGIAWSQSITPGQKTAPALSDDGSRLYLTDAARAIYFLDALTGAYLCNRQQFGGPLTTPVVDQNGYVYVGSADAGQLGHLHSFELVPSGFGTYTCSLRWSVPLSASVQARPAVAPGGRIVALAGAELAAIDRASGAVAWSHPVPWAFTSAPVIDGAGLLFLPGRDRRVHAFRLEAAAPLPVWDVETDVAGQMSAPAIDAHGRLYVASADRHLYVLQDKPAFKIAFEADHHQAGNVDLASLREIYGEVDPQSNPLARLIRLTDAAAGERQPAYSSDGAGVAYTSDAAGDDDVYLAAAGAAGARNLTLGNGTTFPFGSRESEPAFSPGRADGSSPLWDGRYYLAFTSSNGDARQLRFLDLDELAATGTQVVYDLWEWLARQFGLAVDDPLRSTLVPAAEQQGQAAFSPDGRYLAYSACTDQSGRAMEVIVIDLTAAPGAARTTRGLRVEPGSCAQHPGQGPAFSPDSRYLVYHARKDELEIEPFGSVPFIVRRAGVDDTSPPSWSPDGTGVAVVIEGTGFGSAGKLAVLQGQRYRNLHLLSDDFGSPAGTRFEEPEHHPILAPEPLLAGDCTAGASGPPVLQPAEAQPGGTLELHGCGFDIRRPEQNQVYFVHSQLRSRWVEGVVLGARVSADDGLGVLEVRVPYLAGDGPVSVVTPFGRAETGTDVDACRDAVGAPGCFRVLPLPLQLIQRASVRGAKIRVLGYGLQMVGVSDPTDVRWNQVFFTDASGQQLAAAQVTAGVTSPCGGSGAPACPPGAPAGIGEVEWLEVEVPAAADNGPVLVTAPSNPALGASCCSFELLQPKLVASPDNGSEGAGGVPGAPLGPTRFTLSGEDFPFDPYFHYTTVDLTQISSDGIARAPLGAAGLVRDGFDGRGTFTATSLSVQFDITGRGGTLTMEGVGFNSGALATTPFRTPLRNLPIIFVPGTSGTLLSNSGGAFASPTCPGVSYPAGADVWMSEDTVFKIASLTFLGINLTPSCPDYMVNATSFTRTANAPAPPFGGVVASRVIQRVPLPGLPVDDVVVYEPFFDFVLSRGAFAGSGMGRPLGNVATGACVNPATGQPANNCFYPFPLDWRADFATEAARLGALVDAVLVNTTGQGVRDKVVIMSHSVGSVVTKYYVRTHTDANGQRDGAAKVDQVISLGGGFLGVPLPYKVLQVGDDWGTNKQFLGTGIEVLDPDRVQEMAQNWPTAYWQLPSSSWFDDPNDACDGGDCWMIQEDGKDFDGDSRCGSTDTGFSPVNSCDPPSVASWDGTHGDATKTLDFLRNAPHDGCSNCFDDKVNQLKFDAARSGILSTPLSTRLGCPDGTRTAGIGDWRCGNEGIFYHRVVGWGAGTVGRMRFYEQSLCARPSIASAVIVGLTLQVTPLGLLGCLIHEDIREPVDVTGDHTVPLRSAVGIVDRFDERIWGIPWSSARNDPAYADNPALFHQRLSWDASVRFLMTLVTGGFISDLSQVPVIASDGLPYFRIAPGNPVPPPGTPARALLCGPGDVLCAGRSAAAAAPSQRAPRGAAATTERWRLTLTGHAEVHVFGADGAHTGPLTNGGAELAVPGVVYDRGDNQTRVTLPAGEAYRFRVQGRRYEAVNLELTVIRDLMVEERTAYLGVPLSPRTVAILVWDGTPGALELDYLDDGRSVAVPPTSQLVGAAASDSEKPRTKIELQNGFLVLDASDTGGAGIDRIVYGFDRGHGMARDYDGPVQVPEGTSYAWAFATDRAGNSDRVRDLDLCPDCTADLALEMEVGGDPEVGSSLVYELKLANLGPDGAHQVALRQTLPQGVDVSRIESGSVVCDHALGIVLCELDTLDADTSVSVQIEVAVTAPGELESDAQAVASEHDPDPANNVARHGLPDGGGIPGIFSDDFESGDPSAWSSRTP